jgi:signal transduction histidine kinase/ligand-binding sensor domain-containing protein
MKYSYFLFGMLFIATSCTFKKEDKSPESSTKALLDTFSPPRVTVIAELADSLQPKTVSLDKVSKPLRVFVPKTTGSSYSVTTSKGKVYKINLEPPIKKLLPVLQNEKGNPIKDTAGNLFVMGEGGISNFTNFTTDDGLALDAVTCSLMDKSGNLWFGTSSGGISRYDGKSFTTFTSDQGLANNNVLSIKEDKSGNLWFGTKGGGVSCYDGRSFTTFTFAKDLANNSVLSIAEDKSGNLWFGTGGGGVLRCDPSALSRTGLKSFTNFTDEQGLANNTVNCIAEDKSGNLWFGTNGGGVSRLNADGKSFFNYNSAQGLANNIVNSIMEDKSGNLWFGTTGGGVSQLSRDRRSFTNFTNARGLANNDVRCIAEDKSGNLWFGTNSGGVSRYNGKSFTTFSTGQGLAGNWVYSIVEDKMGNLWFGTYGGGVSRYDGRSFTNFSSKQGLTWDEPRCIAEDKTGNLWFGTNGGGVSRYDGKSFTNFTISQGLANNFIWSIADDRLGILWFGTYGGGVSRYDGKSFTTFTSAQGLADNRVRNIVEDKSGNLWFGTDGGGVSRLTGDGGSITNFTTFQGLANNRVRSIAEDKWGNLWFGTYGGGVSRLSRDLKSITNFTTTQGLADNIILCIASDKSGNLWFGTPEGLSFMNREEVMKPGEINDRVNNKDNNKRFLFKTFKTKDGLPDNFVTQVMQLPDGKMAVGTNRGITFFNPAPGYPDGFTSLSGIEIYNSVSGYPVKDVNVGQNCMYQDSRGIIWAGTGNDKTMLVRFDPSALHINNNSPTLFIQSIKVNEENICWNDIIKKSKVRSEVLGGAECIINPANIVEEVTTMGKVLTGPERENMRLHFGGIKFDSITRFNHIPENLILPYRHNKITFEFGAIEVDKPNSVQYQYILIGYDKEWSPVLKKTSATFGNISEGTYTFKVKAQSPNGVWCTPVTYTFKVLPPWYRSWWAYLVYTLAFLLALRIFSKYRERRLRAEKEKLEKKVEERTSELKEMQSQLVQQEKLASLGALTAGIAHEIKNPLNFVNNFAELSNELLEELKTAGNEEEKQGIMQTLRQNLEKINHHGKRADSIVKSMLEHSRSGTGEKQLTDINKLCDEYLNLAYHGMRANLKDFNCTIERNFEENLPKLNIVPQDISRVLLNLINNAFYAIKDKPDATLTLTTMATANSVIIKIKDNGTGIPEDVRRKIFEPFFTTKPAGSGTGLGLSLSFDIIKAHGGKIEVDSKENEYTEFKISLPV